MAPDTKPNEASPQPMTAAGRYEALVVKRTPFLERARRASELTIPGLIPREGYTSGSAILQPFQSIGADGVNNLSAKLLLALFPPGQGFFRLTMDDFTVEKIQQRAQEKGQNGDDARATYEDALGKVERAVINRMEQKGNRSVNHEALQHLLVGGNALVYVKPDGGEKFFPLSQYVVARDLDANVLEIVVKESLSRVALPANVRALVQQKPSESPANDDEKNVDIYTWIKRADNGSWSVHQEVEGSIIPGSKGSYPKDRSAWLPLRWRTIPGEAYGRGRVEEYFGDVMSSESLQQSIVEFAIQAAKVNWLVNENGQTDKKKLAESPNGAVLSGTAKDVTVLTLDKTQDFQAAVKVFDDIKQRLDRAFLNASAVQRNAERVTAEEIRAMIAELEQALGGVYPILADEFQRPLATRLLHQMMAARELPQLPRDVVSPQIVTGMDGLSRQSDLQKLDTFIAGLAQEFGPEVVAEYINVGAYITRRGSALGIDLKGLVRSEEDVQSMRAQKAQSEAVQKIAPAGIKAAADLAKTNQPTQ